MPLEIERKFLVRADFRSGVSESVRITQGYLCSQPERTVRLRLKGSKGFLTIKGPSTSDGLSRYEWEKEIPLEQAEELLKLCEPEGIIDKTRHIVPVGKHLFEVDEFHGSNSGLIVAEIELGSKDEAFEKPDWLGEEVTGDKRYYNSFLAQNPFKNW